MDFRTKIPLKKQTEKLIDYKSDILLIGSCFSENIGEKFQYFRFNTVVNPFGILFNPKAIEQFIAYSVHQKKFTEIDIFYHNERWHCFDAHSVVSSSDKGELLTNLNKAINLTFQQLNKVTHVIITLGTSWVYKHLKSDKVVANCHKIPQREFSKEILSVDEITKSLREIIALIGSVNKEVSVIFTVSPVRHLKDGFVENQQSKAHLLTAIHNVCEVSLLKTPTYYFPSYEIMMDELRDYRFYTADMIHPNITAINYIWHRFVEVWLSLSAIKIMQEVEVIQKGLAHRPFNENSEKHQQFLQKIQSRIKTIQKKYPNLKIDISEVNLPQ